jgi:hypothetical protein
VRWYSLLAHAARVATMRFMDALRDLRHLLDDAKLDAVEAR